MQRPDGTERPAGTSTRARRRPASTLPRAIGGCALVAASVALAAPSPAGLERRLQGQGLAVVPGSVRWLGEDSLGTCHALLLARASGGFSDVYSVRARVVPGRKVLSVLQVANLTRSPDADEEALVQEGDHAAFVTRVGQRAVAFTLLDLNGAPEARQPSGELGQRLRGALTRWQQTGRPEGFGQLRFDLRRPATSVTLALRDGRLVAGVDGAAIAVRTSDGVVDEGAPRVQLRPRLSGTTGWVTWAVDSVRAIPWIGGTPIAWAEHLAFGLQHEVARARVAIGTDHSQDEVAEDLADILHAGPAAAVDGPVSDWPPARLTGLISPAISREGEWIAGAADDPFFARNPGAPSAFLQSFVRTDRERPDTRVYVTLWDPRQVELHVVPGSQEPIGATGETGSGSVPRDARTLTRLAAGFNGGFQALHGEWGVFAEGTMFLPPKPWGATIVALDDGRTGFGSWPSGPLVIPREVSEFRQNLTSLVEDGRFNPYHRTFWGGTVPGAPPGESHTARTGLCITRESFVAFFWGNGLTERSLADGMLSARCTFGVHLDMNGANTGFEFLRVTPTNATPPLGRALATGEHEGPVPSASNFTVRARRMVRGMHEMSFPRYIKRDPRDFFYLMLRPVLPGAALQAPVRPSTPGEGVWRVAGLGNAPFPWPMARTRVRPDPAQPERWVNLVRVDPRRVAFAPAEAAQGIVARWVGASSAREDTPRLTWSAPNEAGRWSVATSGEGVPGTPLDEASTATRGACIDRDGFLVVAVVDRAVPGLVSRAFDLAGCAGQRLALPAGASLVLPTGADAAGAAVDPTARPLVSLVLRDEPGATRMFPEVTPVPQRVWYDAQHRRVRYQRAEDGTVQVQITGGQRITAPTWGPSTRPATPGGTAPPTPTP